MERKTRTREGLVVGDRMQKTRIVEVLRLFRHPRFQKVIRKRVRYAVHDEKNETKVGDKVRILETRALSRTKHWRIIQVMRQE